jgi:pyochelin synthetase
MEGAVLDTLGGPAALSLPLSPIQRSYLVGDQEGLELRGPARYYVPCDIDPASVPGLGDRLRELARDQAILRAGVGPDLALFVRPPDAAADLSVDVRRTTDEAFAKVGDSLQREFTDLDFDFGTWPQLRLAVVCAPSRARLHLIYALWMMDATALEAFLAALTAPDSPKPAVHSPAAPGRSRTERDERYWLARAGTLPGPAQLPLRPDWRRAGREVGHRTVVLEAEPGRRIAATAAGHGLSLATVCLTAYGIVLGRLGGGVAHTVTVLHSRRPHGATGDLGNQGTTVPIGIPALGESSFAELARTVQARTLSHALHSSIGGARIARLTDPGSTADRLSHPFAFTAFTTDTRAEADRGLRRCWDEVRLQVPQVLIDHQAALDVDGTVRLGFDWRTDAFDPGFAEDFLEHCARLVRLLAQGPESWDRPLSDVLPSLDPAPAPNTDIGKGQDGTLHERVLLTAAAYPDRPAAHDDNGTMTYSQLVARALAAADLLRSAGVHTGDRVAVHLPRGAAQVVAQLGILLAGCVFVPIDLAVPPGRLDSMARRAVLRFAFTALDRPSAAAWEHRGVCPLTLPDPLPDASPNRPAGACPTAYVIFTSGSTGEPKGVVVSHSSALATLDAVNGELGVGPGDSVLNVSSIGFDLSVYDVFGPLLRGGSVVLLSEEAGRSPADWVNRIQHRAVTLWNSAPALATLLAQEGAPLPSIRAFLLSGDWIPLTLPDRLRRLSPTAELISLGGATEGAVWSILHRIRPADCAGRSIPYGRPLPGQDVLVLDPSLRACPDWAVGELYLAGAGVADGYENDPERTAAAFLDHPRHGRVYRTGDRGRRLPGGVIEFLGRTDTQVKLNGHRVELGEIEHVLTAVPGVRRCVVTVRGTGRDARVAAFVTLEPGLGADWRDVARTALADALPAYMVPNAIVELDELPLTASSKLDRRRLDALTPPGPGADAPDVLGDLHNSSADAASAPGGPYGYEVAACWQEILGRPPGPGGFFEDGGGSYDAIRLLSLLRSGYGHEVSYGRFMAEPTAAGLARNCRERRRANDGIWVLTPRPILSPQLRVVLFPPVGGAVSCYADPVRGLGETTSAHLIGFDEPAANAPSMADLAQRCLAELPAEVLTGDAVLVFAGWSFGGALAFEAARLSPAPVARVVVIDTPPPTAVTASDAATATAGSAVTCAETGATLSGFLDDIRRTSGAELDPEQALTDPALAARFAVYRQNMRLLAEWVPPPSAVPVHHFLAADTPAPDSAARWSRIAPIVASTVLAGGHFDVFADANAAAVIRAVEGERP